MFGIPSVFGFFVSASETLMAKLSSETRKREKKVFNGLSLAITYHRNISRKDSLSHSFRVL